MVAADGHIETVSLMVNPQQHFAPFNIELHGIDAKMVEASPTIPQMIRKLRPFLERNTIIQHSNFDKQAMSAACSLHNLPELKTTWVDSVPIARRAWPELKKPNGGHGLANLKVHLGLDFNHHDAEEDARAAAEVVLRAEADLGLTFHDILKPKGQRYEASVSLSGNQNGPLYEHSVCFTGKLATPRTEVGAIAAAAGMDVKTSVSKKVTILVVGDQDLSSLAGHDKSSKHRRAEELQAEGHAIRIVGETEFYAMLEVVS